MSFYVLTIKAACITYFLLVFWMCYFRYVFITSTGKAENIMLVIEMDFHCQLKNSTVNKLLIR